MILRAGLRLYSTVSQKEWWMKKVGCPEGTNLSYEEKIQTGFDFLKHRLNIFKCTNSSGVANGMGAEQIDGNFREFGPYKDGKENGAWCIYNPYNQSLKSIQKYENGKISIVESFYKGKKYPNVFVCEVYINSGEQRFKINNVSAINEEEATKIAQRVADKRCRENKVCVQVIKGGYRTCFLSSVDEVLSYHGEAFYKELEK